MQGASSKILDSGIRSLFAVPAKRQVKKSFDSAAGSKRAYPGKGALAAIDRRRGTVKTIEKITGVMKLVAQAQLMRDAKAASNAAPFFTALQPFTDKLPENKNENKKVLTIMVTSNRGLCGPLNAALIRDTVRSAEFPKSVGVFIYGDKGATALEKRSGDNEKVFGSAHPGRVFSYSEVASAAERVAKEDYDEVNIIFNKFVNMNVFNLASLRIPSGKYLIDNAKHVDYDYDENKNELFRNFHEHQLAAALNYCVWQNNASETLSRRNAMDNASKNCQELKKKLNIIFNKLRQSIITTELIEVTVGAVAVEEMAA